MRKKYTCDSEPVDLGPVIHVEAARLVRLEASEATIRGQGKPLEHKLPGHLTSRVNIMLYNKTFKFTGLPAKCDSKC